MEKWTKEHIKYLTDNFHNKPIQEISNTLGRTVLAVKTKALKIGLKRGNKYIWNEKEVAYLKANYEHERIEVLCEYLGITVNQIYHKANVLGLKKSRELIAQIAKENLSDKFLSYSKKKGDIPHNKGVKMRPEVYEKVRHTMFKKGNMPQNTKHNGFLSMRKSKGFNAIYVRVELAKWIPLSRYLWEKEHGAIPEGHIVSFIDGDWQNCTIENLKLLSRAENMQRNSLHNYPKHIRNLISLQAVISRKINNISRKWKTN